MTTSASTPTRTPEELLAAFPSVRLDHDNAPFYDGLLDQRLLINRCDECGTWHHPPRPICNRCWSRSITPTEVAGTGTIAMITILRQGVPQPGVDFSDGHPVVAVDLDEQPSLRLSGTVVGTSPEDINLGDRVRVVWRDIEGREPRPDFEVIAGGGS